MEARLEETLGARLPIGAALGNGVAGGSGNGEGSHPIVINMPPPPPHLTVDEVYMAYHRGVEANKRANETIITTGTKYSEKQIIHLLAFCGLKPGEQDLLPTIWTNI